MKTILPVFTIATSLAFASMAQADCIYGSGWEAEESLFSYSAGNHAYLPEEIPLIEGYKKETVDDLGAIMNFECLQNTEPPRYAPPNYNMHENVRAISEDFSIRFRFTQASDAMQAEVTCEDVTISFNPHHYIGQINNDNYDSYREISDQASKAFMGNIISVISSIEVNRRNTPQFTGLYSLPLKGNDSVTFTADEQIPPDERICLRFTPTS